MKTRKLIAGTLGAALLVSALPGVVLAQDETQALSPEGVEWTLTTLAGEPVPEGVEVTLFLSGGEVVGNAGCNSYFGSYELSEDSLTFPNPFGVTLKLCEDELMAVEGTYLPLLQATIDWNIDDEGALSLSDEDGVVQLIYGEAPIDITMTDVEALVATLGDLQAQIDAASAEVAAVAEETAAIPVNRFDQRVSDVERRADNQGRRITEVERRTEGLNVQGLQRRIAALEETVTRLDRTIDRFRDRIIALEQTAQDHEDRIAALEDEVPTPE
ncbi:MAG: META domain-containing protein [Candidatus Limnocylindrales bacterium]